VAVVGMVPPGPSGVRDYGRGLAQELSRRGFDVQEAWVTSDGRRVATAVADAARFLRLARSLPSGTPVVWNYSSFAYGLRGLPLPGVLFGVVRRARGQRVVTVMHELTYPWGRRGWRGNVQAVTQRIAFEPVLRGSAAVVVTTPQRAAALSGRRWARRRPVFDAPVFSTLGVPGRIGWRASTGPAPVVGVLNYTGDGARPDVVVGALARLPASGRPSLVLLGAPGPDHPTARRWSAAAQQECVGEYLSFTGIVAEAELRARIEACTALVLPNDHGPSGRRTTLAASLAYGVPTLTLDGPETWPDLVAADAVEVVGADAGAFADALQRLLGSAARQQELSRNGRRFYEGRMAVELLGDLVEALVRGDAR
jgi:glycosyltransferase involved in cell wall biosynthesis